MAGVKPRIQRVLEELYQNEKTIKPREIAGKFNETPGAIGKDLHSLKQRGLADTEGEGQWKITNEGREWLESSDRKNKGGNGTKNGTKSETKSETNETSETVPSQADLFRAEGQRVGFGSRKGDIKLDAVVNYVERIADLDDLTSVWNALTEMGVATNIKRTWLKLYAQNLPGKEIPTALKTKLEEGTEAEKVMAEGEVAAKPKRFIVVNGQIIGDPEGDLSFNEALKLVSDASPAQAAEMATTFAKMNTDTMNLLIPLLTKAPEGTSVTQLLITQMGDLQKELRSREGSSEATQQIQGLTQQLSELRDTLHNEQLARIQEQNQATTKELLSLIGRLEQQIKASTEGKQVESKIGLMSKALDTGAAELRGIRSDLKPLAQTFMEGRVAPGEKTPAEKAGFGAGLDKGMKRAREATQLENELFFTGGTPSE